MESMNIQQENDYIDLDEAREKLGRQSTREEAFNKVCNE